MLKGLFEAHQPPPYSESASGSAEGHTQSRGLFSAPPSAENTEAKSGGFRSAIKDLVSDLKPAVKSIKSFVTLDGQLGKDITDVNLFPEVARTAQVRHGIDIGPEEKEYLLKRKARVRDQFARYMGWDPSAVHPDDVPTVAFGGSGGGYRAMLAVLGYTLAMKQAGMWDLLTYVSGVSGSCWAIAAYFTFGGASVESVIEHCKKRLSPHHPLSPDAIGKLLGAARGDYQTLGPLIQKQKSGLHTVPMDLYAVFTTGYLFMQPDPMLNPGKGAEAEVPGYHKAWWKWTDARKHLEGGEEPLPIMTAIRHERPWKDWADPEHPFATDDPTTKEHQDAKDAWYQWFEITPYEVGCDELEAFVPTWGFGRKFEEGSSIVSLPEQSLALLIGLCVSAPAGPLSSYLATIQRNLPAGFIADTVNGIASGISKLWGKHETAVFENHHPLHASNEWNFLYHYTPTPKGTPRPPGIENSPKIHLIDSGMDNNCPTYVMLHPDRKVDVILNMDASSDVQKDSFQQRVSQIGYRRGLDFKRRHELKPDPNTANPDRFKGLYAQIYDGAILAKRPEKVIDSYGDEVTNPPGPLTHQECTMVYLPLLPNERAVPGYDPSTAKFSGSYNLVWTPEQIDMIIKTSVANFQAGQDTVKEALFNAWQRKKYLREQGVPLPPRGPPTTSAADTTAGTNLALTPGTHASQGSQPQLPQVSQPVQPPVSSSSSQAPLYPQHETLPDGSPIPPPPPYPPSTQEYPAEKQ
ncbi:FabD/lysophospholipase-like protein [Thozetella sp. PMI_491]|nr:FabD/lysophospholipase-like protein [Thozetella sp. PMI_491]